MNEMKAQMALREGIFFEAQHHVENRINLF
jgi:hypothetical protein